RRTQPFDLQLEEGRDLSLPGQRQAGRDAHNLQRLLLFSRDAEVGLDRDVPRAEGWQLPERTVLVQRKLRRNQWRSEAACGIRESVDQKRRRKMDRVAQREVQPRRHG